ncbi:hypothetical protein [Phaeobacter inhibens]|uniref:hypothetical protein n=1 Tax=Phaeobacter inhibens TaxID=221822 RepID=UPI0021A61EC0|nr:hypothetical protein [Phaeobacter inhibens]UWR74093.1 hypothetical protein K4L00_08320 [Phaeobacter inhibens]
MCETYETPALRKTFASLVKKAGGGPSVCMAIKETTGRSLAPGTLSKIADGSMRFDWHLAFQIEDIAEQFPITGRLKARIDASPAQSDLQRLAYTALKEIGEVPAAVCSWVATGDLGALEKEGPEGLAALEAFLQAVREAKQGEGQL